MKIGLEIDEDELRILHALARAWRKGNIDLEVHIEEELLDKAEKMGLAFEAKAHDVFTLGARHG